MTKKNSKAKGRHSWKDVKKFIKAQCDEFDKMIFGICDDPEDFTLNKEWRSSPMWHTMALSFGILEYDEQTERVILSYISEVGYTVQKVYLKVDQISALRDFLISAYFFKRGRRQIEK